MLQHHTSSRGHRLVFRQQTGQGAGVIFLSGYRSDMDSNKGTKLAEFCAAQDIPFTRMDYFAHGASEGDFVDFRIGTALADVLEILDHYTTGPQLLVGSSMGGWLALLVALARPERVRGLVGVAPAPDFTERLMYPRFSEAQRAVLASGEPLWLHSDFFNNDYPVAEAFFEEARQHLLLDDTIPLDIPIALLHGQEDVDVPYEISIKTAERLLSKSVHIHLIKDGDHRLNREEDVACLLAWVEKIRTLSGSPESDDGRMTCRD